jgi:hypothetical protein
VMPIMKLWSHSTQKKEETVWIGNEEGGQQLCFAACCSV